MTNNLHFDKDRGAYVIKGENGVSLIIAPDDLYFSENGEEISLDELIKPYTFRIVVQKMDLEE